MRCLFIFFILLGLTLCVSTNNLANAEIKQSNKSKFKFYPYTKKSNPKTWRSWGKANVAKINKLRKQAADIALQNSKCDDVVMSELSGNRSIKKKKIVIFVDCNNYERFYLTEKQIIQKTNILTEKQSTKSISNVAAKDACRKAIKARLKYSSSYDESFFGSGVTRGPVGKILVTIDFEAKNGVGASLPQRGLCYIDSRGLHTVEIKMR